MATNVFEVSAESVFIVPNKSAQMERLALRTLDSGLNNFTAKRYDSAIADFKKAIRLAPTADSTLNAYDYMARAQLSKGDTRAAIESYEKALRIDPTRDDLYSQLGNIHTTLGDSDEAVKAYEMAVSNNPRSAANRYSLGQGYLATGQYREALQQFQFVRQLDSQNPYGDFGMGQAYAKLGRYEDAIAAFDRAIDIKSDYWDAYAEKGYALADSGAAEDAQAIAAKLLKSSPALSALVTQYTYEHSAPKMVASYVTSLYTPFMSTLGPKTAVSSLSGYLAGANSSQTVAMEFQFSKQMDSASVENVFNWSIARSIGTGRGDGYNMDMPLAGTEVTLDPYPTSVMYNSDTLVATVMFTLRQNSTANGTLDPSHIKFSFAGKDATGMNMDASADEYMGFNGFA